MQRVPTMAERSALDLPTHFMIRVTHPAGRPEAISGLVERLGTGEKCAFRDGAELLALVTRWPASAD